MHECVVCLYVCVYSCFGGEQRHNEAEVDLIWFFVYLRFLGYAYLYGMASERLFSFVFSLCCALDGSLRMNRSQQMFSLMILPWISQGFIVEQKFVSSLASLLLLLTSIVSACHPRPFNSPRTWNLSDSK